MLIVSYRLLSGSKSQVFTSFCDDKIANYIMFSLIKNATLLNVLLTSIFLYCGRSYDEANCWQISCSS